MGNWSAQDPSAGDRSAPVTASVLVGQWSAELTVALADLFDRAEREWGQGPLWDDSVLPGGSLLSFLELDSIGTGLKNDDQSWRRVTDPAGRIFSMLGTYPDAALDWLTGENGPARVEYWYGERDWSVKNSGDGFEGPVALREGAIQVDGGSLRSHSSAG